MKWWILILFPAFLHAQEFQFKLETNTIPVFMEGWQVPCPWAGGESESAPGLCDIDGDGDLDFFLGNFLGKISFFINQGDYINPHYLFVTWNYAGVNLQGFLYAGRTDPVFADIDGDGDYDLFTGDFRGLIHFWENVGNPFSATWQFVTDTLAGIDADGFSKFNFRDMDSDEDFDIVLGDYFGKVWLYQNSGTPYAFNFSAAPVWIASIDVGQNASPGLVDIDADNDYDLFIGERYGKIWYYRNDGDSVNYDFTYVTDNFEGIDVGDYSSPEFADIDGDGDYDLFVGREANAASLIGDVFFYENTGTPQNAQFQLVAKNYLMVDVTQFAPRPQVVDMNADNAKDLIMGAGSILDYFENTGDSSSAQFVFIEQGFQGISESGIQPYFVDIDADGDYDLFCGTSAIPGPPALALYLNQGTPRNPNFQIYSSQFLTNPDFFVVILPVLADIDADGDYDLFLFDDMDRFYFYQNNGTPQWPNFVLITNQWQGIHQFPYPDDSWYGFTFADLDEDQDLDLLICSPEQDNVYFYRNTGTPQSPNMVLETETFLGGSFPSIYTPYLVDIDADDDYDLFVGHINGGMLFFRNVTGEPPAVPPVYRHPQAGLELSLGPNPANPVTWISFTLPAPQEATLAIYNILGAKVTTLSSGLQPVGTHTFLWNASQNASGVYIVRLETAEYTSSQRMIIVK